MNASLKTTTTALAIAAAFGLAACDRADDERTAGERADTAVASAERQGAEARSDVQRETAEARSDVRRETAEARSDVNSAVDKAGDKMKDASITTKVNAELAGDNDLSALKINVDTNAGHVVLRGNAPNDAARERATTLAQRVEGVLSVDNQLNVGNRG